MPQDDDLPLDFFWDLHHRPLDTPEVTVPKFSDLVQAGDFVIGRSRSEIFVLIKPNGELWYGPSYEPDEAARTFWRHMARARLQTEDRLLLVQHMEAVLANLGRYDMYCEECRIQAENEQDPYRKSVLEHQAEIAIANLQLFMHQTIELGRALARRDLPVPQVPEQIPLVVQQNEDTQYQGREGLPHEEPGE